MCPKFCTDAKPYKHTQTLTLRKARGIVRFWRVMWGEGLLRNPSVLTAKSLINQKGGCIASKTQQSDSLRLAVNPPPFNKGGKFSTGRSDGCAFEKVLEMERVDATGGASKARKP